MTALRAQPRKKGMPEQKFKLLSFSEAIDWGSNRFPVITAKLLRLPPLILQSIRIRVMIGALLKPILYSVGVHGAKQEDTPGTIAAILTLGKLSDGAIAHDSGHPKALIQINYRL